VFFTPDPQGGNTEIQNNTKDILPSGREAFGAFGDLGVN